MRSTTHTGGNVEFGHSSEKLEDTEHTSQFKKAYKEWLRKPKPIKVLKRLIEPTRSIKNITPVKKKKNKFLLFLLILVFLAIVFLSFNLAKLHGNQLLTYVQSLFSFLKEL